MRIALILTFVVLSGCAGSFERVRELRAQAPEWYAARKLEFAGEDYARIGDIPSFNADEIERTHQPLTPEEISAARARFAASDRTALPEEDSAELQAWVADVQTYFLDEVPEADFLTDEDIQALKERFDVARARL
ncbi:MAG: hypothetical protein AAFO63_03095 [Pseudomonadota bacterium]